MSALPKSFVDLRGKENPTPLEKAIVIAWREGTRNEDKIAFNAAAELEALQAEIARKNAILQAVMTEQRKDWLVEYDNLQHDELIDMQVPVGWLRSVDAELKK